MAIRRGRVFVNGAILDEPYAWKSPESNMPPVSVPQGALFVLGDNREQSSDSRAWGFVPMDQIHSKAYFRIFPLSRLGVLD